MKIRPLKLSQIETNYLMELYREYNANNREDLIKELTKRLKQIPLSELLSKWQQEKNQTLKELLELAIAEVLKRFEPMVEYNEYPKKLKLYIENVISLDAICILMTYKNEKIREIARVKYYNLLEDYMSIIDDDLLYQREGDDSYLLEKKQNNVIEFPRIKIESSKKEENGLAKIYKFRKK